MNPPRNSNEVDIESITQAMVALMAEMRFEDITITELVRRAGVSRNSFYRNFKDMDDVLRRFLEGETEEWMTANGWDHTVDPISQELRVENLLEAEFDRAMHISLTEHYDPWKLAFLIGGVYKLYCHWVETDYTQTPKEVAAYFSTFKL